MRTYIKSTIMYSLFTCILPWVRFVRCVARESWLTRWAHLVARSSLCRWPLVRVTQEPPSDPFLRMRFPAPLQLRSERGGCNSRRGAIQRSDTSRAIYRKKMTINIQFTSTKQPVNEVLTEKLTRQVEEKRCGIADNLALMRWTRTKEKTSITPWQHSEMGKIRRRRVGRSNEYKT